MVWKRDRSRTPEARTRRLGGGTWCQVPWELLPNGNAVAVGPSRSRSPQRRRSNGHVVVDPQQLQAQAAEAERCSAVTRRS